MLVLNSMLLLFKTYYYCMKQFIFILTPTSYEIGNEVEWTYGVQNFACEKALKSPDLKTIKGRKSLSGYPKMLTFKENKIFKYNVNLEGEVVILPIGNFNVTEEIVSSLLTFFRGYSIAIYVHNRSDKFHYEHFINDDVLTLSSYMSKEN